MNKCFRRAKTSGIRRRALSVKRRKGCLEIARPDKKVYNGIKGAQKNMVLLADYRLVEQGGLFFRKSKGSKRLPDMRGNADSARASAADDDKRCRM